MPDPTAPQSNIQYTDAGKFTLTFKDFSGGINTARDPRALKINQTPFAINTDTYYERDFCTASGFANIGGLSSGSNYLCGVLNQVGGSDILLRIIDDPLGGVGVQLQKYNGSAWTNIGAPFGTNADRVPFSITNVQFGNTIYAYFCNGVTTLRRTDGTTYTAIQNSSTDIICKYITTIQNVLVLGNFTATYANNQVVWSKPGTDQFYKDGGETFLTTSNIANFTSPVTQVITPYLWNNLVYVFSQASGVAYLDPFKSQTGSVDPHNTISSRSVAFGEGIMAMFDPNGRIFIYDGSGAFNRISRKIERIIQYMNPVNIPNVSIGINNGKLRCWIGDITNLFGVTGDNYSNVELEFDILRSNERGELIWRARDSVPASQYTNFTSFSGFQQQYISSNASRTVFLRDSGKTADGATIITKFRLPDTLVSRIKEKGIIEEMYIKYRPSGNSSQTIVVKTAYDGATSYTAFIPDTNQKIGLGDSANLRWTERRIVFPSNRVKSFSLELSSTSDILIDEIEIYGQMIKDDLANSTT